MASVEHAQVGERHTQAAYQFLRSQLNRSWSEIELENALAQVLADEYARGQDDAWDAAIKALRGMQPGPAKAETSFERFSANSKTILDTTRILQDARPRR